MVVSGIRPADNNREHQMADQSEIQAAEYPIHSACATQHPIGECPMYAAAKAKQTAAKAKQARPVRKWCSACQGDAYGCEVCHGS